MIKREVPKDMNFIYKKEESWKQIFRIFVSIKYWWITKVLKKEYVIKTKHFKDFVIK